jgi:N-acetylneuraminic acid mutarotase
MRRLWIAFVALVLLSGCTSHSSTAQNAASQQAFVRQLVGYCADVDRHLATVDQLAAPGQTAAQLAKFASQARSQARSHPPPNAQRDQFDTLLTTIDQAVQQFRAAQAALSSGQGDAYRANLMRANQTMQQADKAAVRYGMPHLATCPQAQGAPKQTTQTVAGWHLASDSRYATLEVGAAVDKNGRIWVVGGLTGPDSATTKTEFYDPTTGVWSPGPDLPVALHHVMMVSYQNTVWVIGGLELQGSEVSGIASARVMRLNEAEGLWVDAPALHHARGAAAAAVVGNKIVVVGGRTGATGATPAQDVAPTEVFDGTSWHDAASLPVPGDHLAAASDGKYVYVVGGRKLESAANTAAVQRFDPNTGHWTMLPSVPRPVSDAGVAIVDGQLIVVGGESAGTVFSTVRTYNLASKTWSTILPSLAAPRHGLAVIAVGKTLYAIDGGSRPGHDAPTSTVQTLAVSPVPAQPGEAWQLGAQTRYATLEVGAAVDKGGRIWVAGGLTGPDSATTKTEFYDPTVGVWGPGPDLPVALHHLMMVSYQNTVWVIGGLEVQGSEASGIASARVMRLNQAEDAWVAAPPLHHARGAAAAAVAGNKIVVVGGRTGGTPAQDVAPTEIFDGISWRDAAPLLVPGDHLAAASDGKYLYVVGGRKLESAANTAALQRFDPTANQWTMLPPAPRPVSDAGVAIVDGQLIVVGGESLGTVFNTVRTYNLASKAWSTTLPSLATARHGLAVIAVGKTLYAIDGGSLPGHDAPTSTMQTLTFHG